MKPYKEGSFVTLGHKVKREGIGTKIAKFA